MNISHSRETEIRYLKNLCPSLAFDPEKESLGEWQKRAEEKLTELLGLPYKKCDLLFDKEYEKEFPGFKEIRFTFQSEEGEFVNAILWLPENAVNAKPPVMICLQGHSTGMHLSLSSLQSLPWHY